MNKTDRLFDEFKGRILDAVIVLLINAKAKGLSYDQVIRAVRELREREY